MFRYWNASSHGCERSNTETQEIKNGDAS